MKLVRIKSKPYICFEYHELAWSLRTSGVPQYIFDDTGNVVDEFRSIKRAFCVELKANARYFLRRYYTNSGYPSHTLYRLDIEKGEIKNWG